MTVYECNINGLSRKEIPYWVASRYETSLNDGSYYDPIDTLKDLDIEDLDNQYDTERSHADLEDSLGM